MIERAETIVWDKTRVTERKRMKEEEKIKLSTYTYTYIYMMKCMHIYRTEDILA